MEQEINSSLANDAVMNVKIHDNTLLGRVNDEGKYILPSAVTKELIHAKKYLEQKVEDTIYLSCHLTTAQKNLTMMMTYSLIGNGDKVMVNWALVEEVAIADGLVTNQLVTTICTNVYDYSEDVLLRAFADFNVYIKDEDSGEERKLYDNEKTALSDVIIKYNIAVQTITKKKTNKLCNKVCAKQLDYLKKSKSNYAKTILAEVEKGIDVYITLKTLEEGSVDEIDDKAMLDIINNAVEKVDVTSELEEKEDQMTQKEFHDFRKEIFEDFREETRKLEDEAQTKIVKTATDETKPEILSMLSVIREAENSDVQDTINLKEYLSPKAGQTLEDMERHTENKMTHIAESLAGKEEQDKYQKLDDFLLTQKEKDAKQVKDRKITLDALLTAVTSDNKGKTTHVTTMDNPNQGQTAKVDMEVSSGHGETQVSGAGQTKDKKATKDVEQPKATKKETPKKKTKSTEKKPAPAKAKVDKKENTTEEKSTATYTGESIDAVTANDSTAKSDSNPKSDSTAKSDDQPEKVVQEEKGEKQENAQNYGDNTTMKAILNVVESLKGTAVSMESSDKENESLISEEEMEL